MEGKNQIIYKEPGIDIPATLAQLGRDEDVFIPYRSDLKGPALRMAVVRINASGEPKYSVHEVINGHKIVRKV
jgi:hypothetical protein